MKAIILAGGRGTRLFPLTLAVNKHLLPVYNKPLIYYSLSLPLLAGLREIILVVDGRDLPAYKRLLESGERFGISISYVVQEAPLGLAHGLLSAAPLAGGEEVCLILGDNILFGHGVPELLKDSIKMIKEEGGACLFAYKVHDPERYGVVLFDKEGRVADLEEKPSRPRSSWAVIGVYLYDREVWEILGNLKPSSRGEYEITDVNRTYLARNKLKVRKLGRGYTWFDAGTPESLWEASEFVAVYEKRSGHKIACLEEIAFRQGWITEEQIKAVAGEYKNEYALYLLNLLENRR